MKIDIKKPQIAVEAEKGKRRTLGAEIGIFVLVFLIGSLLAGIIPSVYEITVMFSDPDMLGKLEEILISGSDTFSGMMDLIMDMSDAMYIMTLFCTSIVILTAIIYCTKIEKRSLYSMGLKKEHAGKNYAIGFIIGFVLFSICALLAVLFGGMSFKGINKGVNPGIVFLYLIGYGIQGFSEEITFRGYFMISIMKKNSVAKAVIINSLAFAICHMLNPGLTVVAFINLTLVGIFMSLYVIRTNDLWGAAAYHSMWNFAQGIIYGISVSGTDAKSAIIKTENIGSNIINGGVFGIEASILTTIVMLAAVVILLYRCKSTQKA
ncbi:MAG: CPBP family intramembrane glutamic endopeptidase [Coprococcus sp.]